MLTKGKEEPIILEINYRSTGDNSIWGLERYFTYKPERLLPLIQGYEVHEGNLVLQKEEVYNASTLDLIGEGTQDNVTNISDHKN